MSNIAYQIRDALRYGQVTTNGVPYNWGLAGPDGGWFELFIEDTASPEFITETRVALRNAQDVVRCTVTRYNVVRDLLEEVPS